VPAPTLRADGAPAAANTASLLLGTVDAAPDADTTSLRPHEPPGGKAALPTCPPAAAALAALLPGAPLAAAATAAAAAGDAAGPRSDGLAAGAAAIVDVYFPHGDPAATPDRGRSADGGPLHPPWLRCAGGGAEALPAVPAAAFLAPQAPRWASAAATDVPAAIGVSGATGAPAAPAMSAGGRVVATAWTAAPAAAPGPVVFVRAAPHAAPATAAIAARAGDGAPLARGAGLLPSPAASADAGGAGAWSSVARPAAATAAAATTTTATAAGLLPSHAAERVSDGGELIPVKTGVETPGAPCVAPSSRSRGSHPLHGAGRGAGADGSAFCNPQRLPTAPSLPPAVDAALACATASFGPFSIAESGSSHGCHSAVPDAARSAVPLAAPAAAAAVVAADVVAAAMAAALPALAVRTAGSRISAARHDERTLVAAAAQTAAHVATPTAAPAAEAVPPLVGVAATAAALGPACRRDDARPLRATAPTAATLSASAAAAAPPAAVGGHDPVVLSAGAPVTEVVGGVPRRLSVPASVDIARAPREGGSAPTLRSFLPAPAPPPSMLVGVARLGGGCGQRVVGGAPAAPPFVLGAPVVAAEARAGGGGGAAVAAPTGAAACAPSAPASVAGQPARAVRLGTYGHLVA